jgi:YD repeat-containing protein
MVNPFGSNPSRGPHENDPIHLGNTTNKSWDGNELTAITKGAGTPAAATTRFGYGQAGNQGQEIDPDGNVTTRTFDAAGKVLSSSNAQGTTTFQYDDAGNLIQKVDALGRKTTSAYDGARLTTRTWYNADGTLADVQRFSYDEEGNLISASNNAGTWTFRYDGGRLVHSTDPRG